MECTWDSKNDILYSGFAELNLNKKVQGAKKSNSVPVVTLKDAGRLLDSVTLTWRMVVSIMAELYDPCGFWEPWSGMNTFVLRTKICGSISYLAKLIFQSCQYLEYASPLTKTHLLGSD